ncbi:MAG: alpha/beta hydrolase [Caulobacter sp.]|nr:alpha/beta hydrolase [Caulobacter sp.]
MTVANVVLVHGAFADGSSWAKIIPLLQAAGLRVTSVQNPLTSLADDVTATRWALDTQDGPVLLVGHSWGGAVITEVGADPRVAGLVYIAAAAPDAGQSFNDWWKDWPPGPGLAELRPYGDQRLVLSLKGMQDGFVHDLPRDEAALVHAVQTPLAARCFDDPLTQAAWRDKPCWYIVAEDDRIVAPALEIATAERMTAEMLFLRTSHAPMLSQPKAVADFIIEAAQNLSATT